VCRRAFPTFGRGETWLKRAASSRAVGFNPLRNCRCSLSWFLRDFGYDQGLFLQDQIDEKALVNLRGIVRTSCVRVTSRLGQTPPNSDKSGHWETLYCESFGDRTDEGSGDDLQLPQISQYLHCPRSYRLCYLDGRQERDTRASSHPTSHHFCIADFDPGANLQEVLHEG